MATDYTIVNDATGEEKTISWEGKNPPTQEDIAHITMQLDANSGVPKQKVGEYPLAASLNGQGVEPKYPGKPSLLDTWKDPDTPLRKKIADFIRPTLEGGGMVAGTIAGTPLAPETLGLSALAGASLGYAGGKKLADFIEGKSPEVITGNQWVDPFISSGKDIAHGATMEMGGQLFGKYLLEPTINTYLAARANGGVLKSLRKIAPFTEANTTQKAAQAFQDTMTPESEALARQYAVNEAEAEALRQRVGSDTPFTPGQASNSVQARSAEQSLSSKDKVLAEMLTEMDARNLGAATNNLKRTLGNGQPLPVVPTQAEIGDSITGALDSTLAPIKQIEKQLWEQVPEYPMPYDNFAQTAKELSNTPLIESAQNALDGVLAYAKKVPKTVQGLQSIERTISSEINRLTSGIQPNKEAARPLYALKNALSADFDAMGAAAKNGDIALLDGNLVRPSQIQSDISVLENSLKNATSEELSQAEKNKHLFEFLAKHKEFVMQNRNVSDAQYAQSLQQRLAYLQNKNIGLDYQPPTGAANPQMVENIQNAIAEKQAMLANLQPAEDVAAAYNAAKKFSKEQNFERFGTPAVSKVMQSGEQQTGLKLAPENIADRFFTPQGAKDLVNAVGPQQAANQMKPFVTDMLTNGKALQPDGTLNISRAMALIRQKRATLDNLGLTQHALDTVKGQVPAAIRARLESQGVDILSNPKMGAREAAKFVREYAPSLRILYGNQSRELIAMQDYAKMINILSRNKNVSYSGGATSVEKMMMDAPKDTFAGKLYDNLITVIGTATGAMVTGGLGGVGGGYVIGKSGQAVLLSAKQHQQQIAGELFRNAITNPETAKFLMTLGKGQKVTPAEINRAISTLTGYSVLHPQ